MKIFNNIKVKEIPLYMKNCGIYEYDKIVDYYGDRTAKRSGVPLINHINEGLAVLSCLPFRHKSIYGAFCLHPLIQNDNDLFNNIHLLSDSNIDNMSMFLALEYRNIANQYLSFRNISNIEEIQLSPIKEVQYLLYADKVQNYKDFLIYHDGKHERSKELNNYFKNWLNRLNISDDTFNRLCEWIKQ